MSTTTTIEWTERTWNPVRGCSIVSPGCVNCYAMKQAHRFSRHAEWDPSTGATKAAGPYHGLTKQTKAGPQWTGVVRTVDDALLEPLSWRKPARIFVNSMSDLFHEDVPDAFIDRVFAVMALAEHHTFQILTKRAERMRDYLLTLTGSVERMDDLEETAFEIAHDCISMTASLAARSEQIGANWPLSNVWLGVSCENQQYADERIPLLLQTPAAVRWVSAEPLLGPIDFTLPRSGGWRVNALTGTATAEPFGVDQRPRLDWVVFGGESGPGARPCDLAWIESGVQQCQAAGVACFVKQLGAKPIEAWPNGPTSHHRVRFRNKKGGDIAEFPERLQVREYPRVEVPA